MRDRPAGQPLLRSKVNMVLNRGIAAVLARVPGRRSRVEDTWNGGSFLHWVPDGRGGMRLAGDFLPEPDRRDPGPRRSGPRR